MVATSFIRLSSRMACLFAPRESESRAAIGSTSLCAMASALLRTMISTTIGTRNKMPPTRVVLRKWPNFFILQQIFIGLHDVVAEQLHYAIDFAVEEQGKGKSTVQTSLSRIRSSGKIWVARNVVDPGWFF